jgi:formate dehydrogenase major subunit
MHGQKLIVSDLRENEMARARGCVFASAAGYRSYLALAVTKYIFDNGLANQKFIDKWVNGAREYKKSLEPFTLEMASERCGLPIETLTKVAHMIAEADSVCILWAMGVTQHTHGFRHLNGNLQSAACNRQLHEAGNGRISAART